MKTAADQPESGPSSADLLEELQAALNSYFDMPRQIARVNRYQSAHRSSFALEELEVQFDDGGQLTLMFKDLGWERLSREARCAKPPFLYAPQREISVYQDVLAADQMCTALCYGTVADEQRRRYWLFLEKVVGTELCQVGDFSVWRQVAAWLAHMHLRLGSHSGFADRPYLLHYDAEFYQRWMNRACEFLGPTSADAARIKHLADHYGRVVECLTALPTTFIHGEFYASNVLVEPTAVSVRVCPVDWEMAGLGPGLVDLAALTAGNWTDREQLEMAMTYHAELGPENRWANDIDSFLTGLKFCRLHLAVQWLGWSRHWSPPETHDYDWLREALELADDLSL